MSKVVFKANIQGNHRNQKIKKVFIFWLSKLQNIIHHYVLGGNLCSLENCSGKIIPKKNVPLVPTDTLLLCHY